jgi:phospholipid-binding lipoprotein MlaA
VSVHDKEMPAFASLLRLRTVLPVIALTLLSACATTRPTSVAPASPVANDVAAPVPVADAAPLSAPDAGPLPPEDGDEENDPLEPFNRAMFTFNQHLDRYIAKPVAHVYQHVVPNGVKRGISNFFNNLLQPTIIVNDLLQAKFGDTASDTGRFVVNSTLGVLGVFDVASHFGLPSRDEDFGQTLAVWGVGDGPYLVLPVFGPRNIRDSAGLVAGFYTDPVTYISKSELRWTARLVRYTDFRAQLLGASAVLEQAAGPDQYVFVREAYRQRRQNLIYDGNPPPPKFE